MASEEIESYQDCPEPETSRYGFGTKTHLAKWVDAQISTRLFGEPRYFHWISSSFNPINNPESSNPLEIFDDLSRAADNVGSGDELERLENIRAQLLHSTTLYLESDQELEIHLKRVIAGASLNLFRPEIWRITEQGWKMFKRGPITDIDEWYTVEYNLIEGRDFEVVIS